jgi:hypothetical protein
MPPIGFKHAFPYWVRNSRSNHLVRVWRENGTRFRGRRLDNGSSGVLVHHVPYRERNDLGQMRDRVE